MCMEWDTGQLRLDPRVGEIAGFPESGPAWQVEGDSPKRIDLMEAFWRTILAGQLSKINSQRPIPPLGGRDGFMLLGSPDADFPTPAGIDRQMIRTEGGVLGLGPRDTEDGDVICELYGGKSFYMIRPLKEDNAAYAFLGDVYLHGMMQGEAMQNEREKEWFAIL